MFVFKRSAHLTLVTLLSASVLAVGLLRSAPAAARTQCMTTLKPDSVQVASDAVTVTYSFSESIGTVTSVNPDETSKLKVLSFNVEENTMRLETVSAQPGDWKLTFKGEPDKTCDGRVHVRPALR